jgi:S1-C subfamily serine protease
MTAPLKKITLVIALAAGFATALAVGAGNMDAAVTITAPTTNPAPPQTITLATGGTVLTPQEIYQGAAPGVVVITTTQTVKIPRTIVTPAVTERVSLLGSGFVVDQQGDILTNDHVVRGGARIRVGFESGASYPATVVGTDPSSDLAVVRVQAPATELHPLGFGDSAGVAVGDPAYAIGNPFGLDRTMTAGIISATGRSIKAPNGRTIPNAIQTDASINHGNSGGPLLDRYGRVVGVNDQIESGTGGSVGIGFAISSNTAGTIANRLIANGGVRLVAPAAGRVRSARTTR